nr:efflux pump rdc3 [Quercus suber]
MSSIISACDCIGSLRHSPPLNDICSVQTLATLEHSPPNDSPGMMYTMISSDIHGPSTSLLLSNDWYNASRPRYAISIVCRHKAKRRNSRIFRKAPRPIPSSSTSSATSNATTGPGQGIGEIRVLDWDGPEDPTNPYNWSLTRKWFVAGTALIGTLIVPLNGTSITVAAAAIGEEFHVSDGAVFTNTYWTVTSWSVGGAVFVIVFLPLMEDLGVRRGYLVFYLFFLLMIIPQAVAQNFATLVVTRFFSGGCVALLANTISSVIPDIWAEAEARSIPVGLYIILYLVGSTLGPPMFAGIIQHIGDWRWSAHILPDF